MNRKNRRREARKNNGEKKVKYADELLVRKIFSALINEYETNKNNMPFFKDVDVIFMDAVNIEHEIATLAFLQYCADDVLAEEIVFFGCGEKPRTVVIDDLREEAFKVKPTA